MESFRLIIIILLAFTLLSKVSAQKILTSDSGKKILVNPDGSWQYLDDKASIKMDTLVDSANKNNDNLDNLDPIALFIEKKKKLTQQIFVNHKESQTKLNISERNKEILEEEIKINNKAEDGRLSNITLAEELDLLKIEINVRKKKIKALDSSSKKLMKMGFKNSSLAELTMFEEATKQLFLKGKVDHQQILINANFASSYSFETDDSNVINHPPNAKCNIQFNGVEETTGKSRIDLESQYLFGYTHEKLHSYLKEQDFLACSSQISNLGGLYFLTLRITIRSKKAKDNYGSIDKGSIIRIQLINGNQLYIRNVGPSSGILEAYTGATNYNVIYSLNKDAISKLSDHEIDTIGIIWSSGFEEYEVYHMDVIQDQLKCVKQLVKNAN